MNPAFTCIAYAVQDRVATITLNRPEKLNAVNKDMIAEIVAALDRADADDAVRAVIFTGAGRAYCAGADISGGFALPTQGDPATGAEIERDYGALVILRIFEMHKPVIGAINGAAVGFGATQLLPMDCRIATPEARFAYPFVRRAILPESASSWFLPRLVGMPTALRWMLSGATFPAAEALAGGLVQEIVPADRLAARAHEIAMSFTAETSPSSVALTRRLLWSMLGADHPMRAHALESRGLVGLLRGPDAAEGVNSFLQKRRPEFPSLVSRDIAYAQSWWPAPQFGVLPWQGRT